MIVRQVYMSGMRELSRVRVVTAVLHSDKELILKCNEFVVI